LAADHSFVFMIFVVSHSQCSHAEAISIVYLPQTALIFYGEISCTRDGAVLLLSLSNMFYGITNHFILINSNNFF